MWISVDNQSVAHSRNNCTYYMLDLKMEYLIDLMTEKMYDKNQGIL